MERRGSYDPPRTQLGNAVINHTWDQGDNPRQGGAKVLLIGPELDIGGHLHHPVMETIRAQLRGLALLAIDPHDPPKPRPDRQYRLATHGIEEHHYTAMGDATAALLWLHRQQPGPLIVGGYSYGAWLAVVLQSRRDEVAGWFAINPPLGHHDLGHGLPAHQPGLIAVSQGDHTTDNDRIRDLQRRLERGRQHTRVELLIERDRNHCWQASSSNRPTDPGCPTGSSAKAARPARGMGHLLSRVRALISEVERDHGG